MTGVQNLLKLYQCGDAAGARAGCGQILDKEPDNTEIRKLFGMLLFESGDHAQGREQMQAALAEKSPRIRKHAYIELGKNLAGKNRFAAAAHAVRAAVEIETEDVETLNLLSEYIFRAGDTEEAIAVLQRAVELDPTYSEAYYNLGSMLQNAGDKQHALEVFTQAFSLEPGSPGVVNYAAAKKFSAEDPSISVLEQQSRLPGLAVEAKLGVHFSLGKAYDDIGEYEKAFTHYKQGNDIKRATFQYDISQDQTAIANIMAHLNAEWLRLPHQGNPSTAPIFIVSLPRSGSTLVEQILASHSQIKGLGEILEFQATLLEFSNRFNNTIATVEDYAREISRHANLLGSRYLERARYYAGDAKHFTDKTPRNFLHLGIILAALPNAKIIHCRRDAVATCFGCYRRLFDPGEPFLYSLTELGEYYLLYEKLMRHWHSIVPGKILDVQYEQLVADPEAQIKEILEFCGLSWEDNCMDFYKTRRTVSTLSASQVREPIHKNAVEHWRHYEKYLASLKQALNRS
ncbi:MAG: sulfotransferase [Gammaproteobacteria bacterium]|nr:sulfotransferase [Gammaproteobacteria bacterium]